MSGWVKVAGLGPGDAAMVTDQVRAALDAATGGDRTQPVFLRADRDIPYGELMAVLDALRSAGYLKVALVGLEGAPAAGGTP